MLPIFGANPNYRIIAAHTRLIAGEVANICKQIAPLRREQIDEVESFSLRFQPCGLRRKKMDVRIGSHPTLFSQGVAMMNRQIKLRLSRLDHQFCARGFVFKSFCEFRVTFADRQFDLEMSADVRVRGRAK